MVDGLGVRPLSAGPVPEALLEIMRPQAVNQKWIVEGVAKGDRTLLLHALMNDPQCAHLAPSQVRAMGEELLEANRTFINF